MAETGPASFADLAVDVKAYEELDENFQAIIQELIGDRSLEKFRDEYEKLHKALKRSFDSNKRLITKCRELNDEITSNSSKVERSLELLQQDRRTIAALRQEIDKAWKMVETAQGREKKAGETIEALKMEIAHLTQLVEQGGLLTFGHDDTVKGLLERKEALIKERDMQLKQIVEVGKELTESIETHDKTEKQKLEMEQEMQGLRETLKRKRTDVENETLRRDRLTNQLNSLHSSQKSLMAKIERQNGKLAELSSEEAQIDASIAESNAEIEKLRQENHEAQKKEEDVDAEIARETARNQELQGDLKSLDQKLKSREKEVRAIKNEIDRKSRENHALQQGIIQARHMCSQDDTELATIKTEVAGMEKEVAELHKHLAANAVEHEQLEAKKKALDGTIVKTRGQLEKQQALTREEDEHKRELDGKLLEYQKESMRMRHNIDRLEKDREHRAREAADAQAKYVRAKEEAKMSEIQLSHTQRLIAAADEELKAKQQTYEQLRVERNNYNRQLTQAQDTNADFKKKFKMLTQQAQQLKNEIRMKEDTRASEQFELKKAESKKEKLESKMKRLKADWQAAEATMFKHQEEMKGLEGRIREADTERQKLLDQQLKMMKDRDVLGTQLIRRNDEIALLYEKIKILQDTLKKGEVEYKKRCEDASELQRLIKDTQRKNLILQSKCDKSRELEAKVRRLQDDLCQEQTRVRALSEELEDPNNPHRWRHLYGEDPSPADLLKTIKQLQKRLINKTEEIVNTKKDIDDIKNQMATTQKLMEEQPTPEQIQELKKLQLLVKQKDRQLKAWAAELNTQQAKLAEYQGQYDTLTKELGNARDRQFTQKKVFTRLRDRLQKTQGGDDSVRGDSRGQRVSGESAVPSLPSTMT